MTGRLVNAKTGKPVRGKKTILLSQNPSWGRGFSGGSSARSGRFEVEKVWPGTYYICASARGYMKTCRKIDVSRDRCDLGDVVIHGGVRLTGRVLTSSGKPIAGAEVFIDSPEFYGGRAVQTDARGRYVFKKLSDGAYSCRVRAEGWATYYLQELSLPSDGRKVVRDVRMSKGVRVSGKVLDGTRPVTKQMVILSGRWVRNRHEKRPWVSDASTDESGAFVFEHVNPGKYALRCGLEERNITVVAGSDRTCNFGWPGRFKLESRPTKGGHAK